MNDVPRDMQTIGEVVIRGDNVMDGYYKEPQGTAAVMTGAWFHTGDMAVWDEEDYIHIVDRKKDIIISGGENISSHRGGEGHFRASGGARMRGGGGARHQVGRDSGGFRGAEARSGTHRREQLCEFLQQRIARFKIPRVFEFPETPLPKTGTGKILKRELREMFWAGRAKRVQG